MQLIITWIVAAAMAIGAFFTPAEKETVTAVPAFQETQNGETAAAPDAQVAPAAGEITFSGTHTDRNFEDFAYEHYDPKWFYEDTDRLTALAGEGDAQGVIELYDRLYEAFLYMDAQYTMAMLSHDADIYDEYWDEEYAYCDSLWTEMGDALSTAAAEVLQSPVKRVFREHIGADSADSYAAYEPMTEEQIAAEERELELRDEYYAMIDEVGDISFEYRGQTWTFDTFGGFKGDNLYNNDYEAYLAVYNGLNKALLEAAAPVYIELIELWTRTARDEGYDSYADYAYENVYDRDYSTEQAQAFCDAVKPVARRYYEDLYYSDLFGYMYDLGSLDLAERFDVMETYLPRIDESLLEPWYYMTSHGLYDIMPENGGRIDSAYTTVFSAYGAPFIFQTESGGCTDLQTITHEFGHYADAYFNPIPDAVNSVGSMDVFEIHSNGLQALFTRFYPEIYGSEAQAADFLNIADLMENVIDGCVLDEFQRRVMAEPDGLTAERLNELYLDVCIDYGFYDADSAPEYDAGWVYVSHQFDSPIYYISYAASAFAALQIWDLAQTDFDAAVKAYLAILHAGAYEDGYLTVLKNSGLRTFADEGGAAGVLEMVLQNLRTMERAGLKAIEN